MYGFDEDACVRQPERGGEPAHVDEEHHVYLTELLIPDKNVRNRKRCFIQRRGFQKTVAAVQGVPWEEEGQVLSNISFLLDLLHKATTY